MFKMIVGLLAFSIASAYALTGCHHGHCKSFEKWETSGVYTIRVWHSSENSIQVYRRYGFRKLYDANQRKYRVDAYPLSPADGHEFPVSATGRGPLGPFVVMSTGVRCCYCL
jgi:hypothetical protein